MTNKTKGTGLRLAIVKRTSPSTVAGITHAETRMRAVAVSCCTLPGLVLGAEQQLPLLARRGG